MTELSCFANLSLALPNEALAKLEAKVGGLVLFNPLQPPSTIFNSFNLNDFENTKRFRKIVCTFIEFLYT